MINSQINGTSGHIVLRIKSATIDSTSLNISYRNYISQPENTEGFVAAIGLRDISTEDPKDEIEQGEYALFATLSEQWKREAGRHSIVTKMILHPAYQRIIAMGTRAVPFILKELERQPDHWFWALSMITNESPAPPEAKGNLELIAKAWIEWGKRKQIID